MKYLITSVFVLVLLSASSLQAQEQIPAQPPPPILSDTVSGWKVVYSYPVTSGYSIASLQFPSKDTGYATVYNGKNIVLLRSINAGLAWDTIPTFVPSGPIVFTSAKTGFAGTGPDTKIVYKTTDGGMSWHPHDRPSIASGLMGFADKDTGIILGNSTTARTTDAGETWKEIFTPVAILKNDVSFVDSKIGYAVGNKSGFPGHPEYAEAGYCQKTTDGGATWTPIYSTIQKDFRCCKALNPSTLIVAGVSQTGRTTNGGVSWDAVYLGGTKSEFASMSFGSKAHGIVVGDDDYQGINSHGLIFVTNDTGKTWSQQFFQNAPSLFNDVVMLDDTIALICGDGNIYRTTTGGNPILSVAQHSIDFHVQTYPNPTPGIVTIQYQLPSSQSVTISYYNIQGVLIGSNSLGIQPVGVDQTQFDASALPNGVYYFHLTTPQDSFTGSFRVVK